MYLTSLLSSMGRTIDQYVHQAFIDFRQKSDDKMSSSPDRATSFSTKDILEKLQDSTQADSVNPNQYKFRLNVELDTGDERYNFVNTPMWIGSGCLRGGESES